MAGVAGKPTRDPSASGAVGKSRFSVGAVSRARCDPILKSHHYLTSASGTYRGGVYYALFLDSNDGDGDEVQISEENDDSDKMDEDDEENNDDKEVVGVCVYSGFPVPEVAVGAFGLGRTGAEQVSIRGTPLAY
ncbi:Hypothetical protein UVM_LOCUS141 [uncultured virus]|nr:Hypothetical protein UVM_LOCUS141 [uncultured virus]